LNYYRSLRLKTENSFCIWNFQQGYINSYKVLNTYLRQLFENVVESDFRCPYFLLCIAGVPFLFFFRIWILFVDILKKLVYFIEFLYLNFDSFILEEFLDKNKEKWLCHANVIYDIFGGR